MKSLKWTQNDEKLANSFGFSLRPWRYVEEDGCWTIVRHGEQFPNNEEVTVFVMQRAFFRDGCENHAQWAACNKAALMASSVNETT